MSTIQGFGRPLPVNTNWKVVPSKEEDKKKPKKKKTPAKKTAPKKKVRKQDLPWN